MAHDQDVSTLLKEVATKGESLTTDGSDKARKDLLSTARSLCLASETPIEAILGMVWGEVSI